MSVGPLSGIAGSAAGSPLSQANGSDKDRVRQDAGVQQRRVESTEKAEAAAGVGETDGEDHETAERDADGRRPWQWNETPEEQHDADAQEHHRCAKDPTGNSGTKLDLSG